MKIATKIEIKIESDEDRDKDQDKDFFEQDLICSHQRGVLMKPAMLGLVAAAVVLTAARFSAAAPAGTDTNSPLVLFSFKKSAPVVDGELNDACWKGAQVATGFIVTGKHEKPSADTAVMSGYDDQALYVAVKAGESLMDKLTVDTSSPWRADCIEIFLNPRRAEKGYFHFMVDSAGNAAAFLRDGGGERQVTLPIAAKAKRLADGWSVELAIPFEALGTSAPQDNQHWAFNVARERYTVSPPENSSWAALGTFGESEKFAQLAFYSRSEVVADINYWKRSDSDPLMRRLVVSGFDIAAAAPARKQADLWTYDPYLPDSKKNARWNCYGVAAEEAYGPRAKGEPCPAAKKYPEFYRVAMGINRSLFARSSRDDKISQLRKSAFYAEASPAATNAAALAARLERAGVALDAELNAIYQAYGVAFEDDWNKAGLAGLAERGDAVLAQTRSLHVQAEQGLASLAEAMRATTRWESVAFDLPPAEARPNKDGTNLRLQFAGMRFYGYDEIYDLLGTWDSINWDWNGGIAEMLAPGQYTYGGIDSHYRRLDRIGKTRRGNFPTAVFMAEYILPLPPWLEKAIQTDPDLLVRSQDGLTADAYDIGAGEGSKRRQRMQPGMNPHHPRVTEFVHDYLTKWAAHANRDGRAHFFLAGWEDSHYIQVPTPQGPKQRSVGYIESGKTAFRAYLRERYATIAELNAKWGAAYAAFDAVQPPDDKYISPAPRASGLTYEFERWGRVEHARSRARQRRFLKEGAPSVPVMTDDSITMLEMNGYLNFKEHAADVCSFHSNPGNEEAMWVYLHSLGRRFGDMPLGYYENYWAMYTREHLADERLAQRDVRKFFFTLFMRDVRFSSWWLNYAGHATEYLVAYGGGTFRLDYDQTTVRLCATELPVMFARGRAIERALIESRQEIPTSAIIQPCASIFNAAAMGRTYRDSPPIRAMIDLHYQLFAPGNYPHDYLPEEMVLDGRASLDEYKLLVLAHAPYVAEEFARRLRTWVERGGTLIAVGPFALMNEFGRELPANVSLMKTLWTQADQAAPIEARGVGKGRVVYLGQPVDVCLRNAASREKLLSVFADAAQRTAVSVHPDLKILVRDGRRGVRFLCLSNQNVERPLETAVTVEGRYTSALDVVAPGGFPVPLKRDGKHTVLRVALDPGEWTMIGLGTRSLFDG